MEEASDSPETATLKAYIAHGLDDAAIRSASIEVGVIRGARRQIAARILSRDYCGGSEQLNNVSAAPSLDWSPGLPKRWMYARGYEIRSQGFTLPASISRWFRLVGFLSLTPAGSSNQSRSAQ